jgi:hypothetical protein
MRQRARLFCFIFVIALTACDSGTPNKAPNANAPAEKKESAGTPITAREAFQKVFQSARLWAPDARPYLLQSSPFKDYNGQDGKAVIWRAGFASAQRRTIKAFLWSGVKSEDAPAPGVSSGTEDTYSPNNSSTQVFDSAFLKVDSDKAHEVAQEHGGEKLIKADPKQPIMYLLDWNPKENLLTWHVIYGASQSEAKLRVAVNASTGTFERVEK